jgi:hypothetical protein
VNKKHSTTIAVDKELCFSKYESFLGKTITGRMIMQEKKQIHVQVEDKVAKLVSMNFNLVGGNSDYEVVFGFDGDWDNYPLKTALFVFGQDTREVVFSGNVCRGVAIENATMCLIGVFADDIVTSTPACISDVRHSIKDAATGSHEPPTEDVYNQIMALINRYIEEAKKAVPSGGKEGQVLKKVSDNDYDMEWADDTKAKEIVDFSIENAKDDSGENIFGVFDFKVTLDDGKVFSQRLDLPFETVQIASVDDYIGNDGKRYLKISFADKNIAPLNVELNEIFNFDDLLKIDVTADVGQTIIVKEVDENGNPTKWESADYQPRIAWSEEGGGKVVFIPEQTVTNNMWENLQGSLVEGDVYAVEVNGVVYKCECRSYDGMLYLGNGSLSGDTASENNNEPFCLEWFSGATGGMFYSDGTLEAPVGIKVTDWQDTIYHKIPKEYLPEISWNELTDKPFIEGAGEPLFTHTATFSSDAAAKNGVLVVGAQVTAILDTVYWLEVNGELLKCHWERVSFSSILYDENGNKWVSYGLAGVYVFAPTAGTYTFTLYAPTEELMIDPRRLPPNVAEKSDIPKSANIDVTAEVGQTIIVKEVDAEGKPTEWEAADYQSRIAWSKAGLVQVSSLPAYISNLQSDYGFYVFVLDFNENVESLPLTSVYSIVYDGVEYTNLATVELGGYHFFGNLYFLNALYGTSFANTGEPFLLTGDTTGMMMVTLDTEATRHALQIYIEGTYYHPIDIHYLPQIPTIDLTKYYTSIDPNDAFGVTISGENYYEEVYRILRTNDTVKVCYLIDNNSGQVVSGVLHPIRIAGGNNIYATTGNSNCGVDLRIDARDDFATIHII